MHCCLFVDVGHARTQPPLAADSTSFSSIRHSIHAWGTAVLTGRLIHHGNANPICQFAEECDRMAKQADTERQRSILKEMVEAWRRLAEMPIETGQR
jgi:hypothetical protein